MPLIVWQFLFAEILFGAQGKVHQNLPKSCGTKWDKTKWKVQNFQFEDIRNTLMYIYSLYTQWYSVRNLCVTCFFISSISTVLRTCLLVWHKSIWGQKPSLTPPPSAGNRARNLSFGRPMPYLLHRGHSLLTTYVNVINLVVFLWKYFFPDFFKPRNKHKKKF